MEQEGLYDKEMEDEKEIESEEVSADTGRANISTKADSRSGKVERGVERQEENKKKEEESDDDDDEFYQVNQEVEEESIFTLKKPKYLTEIWSNVILLGIYMTVFWG